MEFVVDIVYCPYTSHCFIYMYNDNTNKIINISGFFFFEIITACYYFGRRLYFDVHSQSLRLIRNIKNGNVLFKSILVFFFLLIGHFRFS
jgi:hypothetical protein